MFKYLKTEENKVHYTVEVDPYPQHFYFEIVDGAVKFRRLHSAAPSEVRDTALFELAPFEGPVNVLVNDHIIKKYQKGMEEVEQHRLKLLNHGQYLNDQVEKAHNERQKEMTTKTVKQIISDFLYSKNLGIEFCDDEADKLIKRLAREGYNIPGEQLPASIMMNKYAARVKEGEPLFFLLGHDKQAPGAIRFWAGARMQAEGPSKQVDRSLEIAQEMEDFQKK